MIGLYSKHPFCVRVVVLGLDSGFSVARQVFYCLNHTSNLASLLMFIFPLDKPRGRDWNNLTPYLTAVRPFPLPWGKDCQSSSQQTALMPTWLLEHSSDALWSYVTTIAACCQNTPPTLEGTVTAMTVTNNLHQNFCHHKHQWTLDDHVTIFTQARGEQKALTDANKVLHLHKEPCHK
jgi:hypothetical protein